MKQVKMVSQFYVHKSQGRIAKFSESYHPSSSTADYQWRTYAIEVEQA